MAHSDILKVAIARCKADASIAGVVGTKVYSNVPKDSISPPYLVVSWSDVVGLDDKSDDFVSGTLTIDYWDESQSDKGAIDMMNFLTDEFHKQPLTLTLGSTNLLITRQGYNVFLESDGVSHHGVITFNLLIED